METSTDHKIDTAREGVTQIGKDVRTDTHAAIDQLAGKVPQATDRLTTAAHNTVDKVADQVSSNAERLIARTKQVQESCKALAESGRDRVRANPAVSVLVAAAAGYGLSKLLSSRSSK